MAIGPPRTNVSETPSHQGCLTIGPLRPLSLEAALLGLGEDSLEGSPVFSGPSLDHLL